VPLTSRRTRSALVRLAHSILAPEVLAEGKTRWETVLSRALWMVPREEVIAAVSLSRAGPIDQNGKIRFLSNDRDR
jgi:hypothetical protein